VQGREDEVREKQQYVGGKREGGETESLTEEQINLLVPELFFFKF